MMQSTQSGETLSNFVAGQWIRSRSERTIVDLNPATARPIASFGDTTREETRQAIGAAREAFPAWRATPPLDRARLLMKFRALLDEHHDRIARTLTVEHGKTYSESWLEIERGIENIEVAAGAPTLMMGRVLEDAASGIDEYTIRRPLGVTAAICPFNFPAMIPLWFLPYALACGNTMVVKASPSAPMTLVEIFKLIEQAGFPAGVASLALGASEAGEELVEHPDVNAVSFVGSTRVGQEVCRRAGAAGKRFQVQAGAKNFGIVMPDADLAGAIPNLVASAMDCSGQRCLALAAVIAVGEAYEKVRDGMLAAARARRLGFGLDDGAQMGPVISGEAKARIEAWIQKGVDEGATAILDGRGAAVDGYPDGFWVGPTILDGCGPEMEVTREEIFGPVVCILRAASLDEALEIIRGSRYGNAASIFTSSGAAARKFRYEAPCGNLGINIGVAAPMAFFPFGGTKDSFFGDLHAQGRDAFAFYTNATVCVERWL
jgi:malonate-semialdehyde dehydrogenase (acetylating)/methylmalonate-semialdehyde dehydrogenase